MSDQSPDTIREEMERIYTETLPAEIPWNIESPPKVLVDLVEGGQVLPCKAIDLGCGAGNYAVYLASKGFDVTGVDISPSAIALARANSQEKRVKCEFLAANALDGLRGLEGEFEFAYDWSVLHHIFPENRKQYVEIVHSLLVPGGKYLSVCFSVKDPAFGNTGNVRRTPLGTVLYFSSEDELRELFTPFFDVGVLETVEIEGKAGPHLMNVALMDRKLSPTG